MIETIGAELFAELVTEVSNSPAWGVMVDETTDISVSKQLGLVVRSVNFQGYSTFSPCWLLCLPLLTNTSFLIPQVHRSWWGRKIEGAVFEDCEFWGLCHPYRGYLGSHSSAANGQVHFFCKWRRISYDWYIKGFCVFTQLALKCIENSSLLVWLQISVKICNMY